MKTYYIKDVEKIFGFECARDISLEEVTEAYVKWQHKISDAYKRGWIQTEHYAKSLTKLDDVAKYLASVVLNRNYDSEVKRGQEAIRAKKREKRMLKEEKRFAEKSALIAAVHGTKSNFSFWLDYLNYVDERLKDL